MRKIKNLLPLGLCLSMCVASLPGNLTLSTARAHAANAFVTSDAFNTKSLPASQGIQPQRTALTGQEWTGTGNNINITQVNTEADTCNPIPYQDPETAFYGARDFARDNSEYYQLLTGSGQKWTLSVDDSSTKEVTLPASWTSYGFDFSIYTNSAMPFQSSAKFPQAPTTKNPVGLYHHTFRVKDSMLQENGRIYLTFGGVESAYYVYVNGQEIGYSEDSYNPHSFDITDALNPKGEDNDLTVKVYKFCDGTWLEDQDMIYDGGIFRDVYLTSTPNIRIADYQVDTALNDDYTQADLSVNVDTSNLSTESADGMALELALYDAAGNRITSGSQSVNTMDSTQHASTALTVSVSQPALWDADHPNLYTMVLSLYDAQGKVHYESVSQNVGFRKLTFTSTEIEDEVNYRHTTTQYDTVRLNGKRLLLKGVNRHDTDPDTGKYVSHKVLEQDILMMKANNINALRTSHYANDDYLYYLCDKYGIYLMCETNNESHAIQNNEDSLKQLKQAAMNRQVTAYKRLRNVTANLMWSIGNESTRDKNVGNFADSMFSEMIQYFKKNDPSRMVHYEGVCDWKNGSSGGVDMNSHMYADPDTVAGCLADETHMPFVLCEYDHAMGNAVGNLKEYWDLIRSHDSALGGFIWDWVDQSRKIAIKDGDWDYYSTADAHQSGLNDLSGYYLGYGGDWGDNTGDKNFCMNGLVSADRDPQPELKEVRYQYQDFWFTCDTDTLSSRTVHAVNESQSKNLNEYELCWKLLEDDNVIDQGTLDASLDAGKETDLTVPYTMPTQVKEGSEYYLNLSVCLKQDTDYLEKGSEIAYEQFPVNTENIPAGDSTILPSIDSRADVTVTKDGENYLIQGTDFSVTVNGTTGYLENYLYRNQQIFTQGPSLNFDRAKLDNDYLKNRKISSYVKLKEAPVLSTDVMGNPVITTHHSIDKDGGGDVATTYTFEKNGGILVDCHADTTTASYREYTKIGFIMTLSEGMEDLSWYGNGDDESYSDRCSYTRVGTYHSTVNQMYYPFAKPQDCGNLTGIRYTRLDNTSTGYGLLVTGNGGTLNTSALHFTPDQLTAANHVNELSPSKETYLTIDGAVAGTGNNSCGFKTLTAYTVKKQVLDFRFSLLPADNTQDSMTLYHSYTKLEAALRNGENPYGTFTPAPTQPAEPEASAPATQPQETPAVAVPLPQASQDPSTASADALKPVTSLKVTANKKGRVTCQWKKQNQATGYVVVYASNAGKLKKCTSGSQKVSGVTRKIVKKNQITLKLSKKKKRIYLKVCAYHTENGKTTYGSFSKTKKITRR